MYYIGYAFIYLISLLPLWWHYAIFWVVYLFNYYVIGYRKKIVMTNLRNSFPEKNDKELKAIAKKFYKTFSRHFAETIKLISISRKNLARRAVFDDPNFLHPYYDRGQNVILCLGHLGNWEMMTQMSVYIKHDSVAVYKPLHNKFTDRLMRDMRSRFGVSMVHSKAVARHMLTKHDNPQIYYMIADQCPLHVVEKYRIPFLNQPTSFFNGVEKLAVATNTAVIYVHIKEVKYGHYKIYHKPITDNPKSTDETWITREFARMLEEDILETPHDWLWSHKRWKR